MPTVVALFLLVSLGSFACGQQDRPAETNMACVKRLLIARYPSMARSAHLSIELSSDVTLTADGTVGSVAFRSAARPQDANLFQPAIEQSIRESTFDRACAQQIVRLSYVFRMDAGPQAYAEWFGYPNRIEVWATTPKL